MSASDEESYASAEEGEGGQRDLKSGLIVVFSVLLCFKLYDQFLKKI